MEKVRAKKIWLDTTAYNAVIQSLLFLAHDMVINNRLEQAGFINTIRADMQEAEWQNIPENE